MRKKIMKNVLMIMAMVVICLAMSMTASAEEFVEGDYTYTVYSGEATITRYHGDDKEIIVPSKLGGYPVTSIGEYTFYYCTSIESVTIPNGVINVYNGAFSNCGNLKSITISESLKSISGGAFASCKSIGSIIVNADNTVYKSVDGILFLKDETSIVYYPAGKTATEYTIPVSVIDIDDYAFYGCRTLKSVTISDSVTNIGNNAFYCCTNLENITIPDSVTSIGNSAFYCCTKLTNITIPESVVCIGAGAFYGTAYYNDNANWEDGMFLYIENCLIVSKTEISEEYKIKSGTRCIADEAFAHCENLKNITLPESVISIGKGAFSYINSLSSIIVDAGNMVYKSVDGILFSRDGTKIICYPAGKTNADYTISQGVTDVGDYAFCYCLGLESITIPDGVTRVGNYAFSDCRKLISVTMPDSIISIGESAFEDCYSLTSIEIPYSVTSIGNNVFYNCSNLKNIEICDNVASIGSYAFYGCNKLTSIEIPGSVTSIGNYAFSKCYSLTSIEIPDSVTSIGSKALYACESLANIMVDENNQYYSSDECGVLFNKDRTTLLQYPRGNSRTRYIIPDSIISIGDSAFEGCDSLTSIEIPDSTTIIGRSAFEGCTNLTSVEIPNSVISIGVAAFMDCESLESVTIPDRVMRIESMTFNGCIILEKIEIPISVTDINSEAFVACKNLTDVYYTGAQTEWNEIAIGYDNEYLTNATIHFNSSMPRAPEHIHSYTSTISTSATCTIDGVKTYECSCGDTYTESIPATGHTEVTIPAVPATCTSTGLTEGKKCTVCGTITVKQNVVAKKPHSSDNGTVTKAAACTSAGTKTYKCTVCKTVIKTETIPATEHKETALNAVAATYKSTGLTAGKKCSVCGVVTVKQTAIPKLTLGKVSGLKAKTVKVAKSSEITLTWDKVNGAEKYEIQQYKSGEWKKIKTTSKTSYTVKKLKSNKSYKFRVRAVVDRASGAYSTVLTVKTVPATISKLTLKAGKKQLTASWKSVSSISGYEVQYSTSKKFTKKTTKTVNVKKSSKKTTIKKLKKGKKYYVRIRTYKTVNGKKVYSSWSTVKNVKVK